jgi:hypothetical protein
VAGPRGPESEGQRLTRAGWGIRDPRLLRVEGRRASVPRALRAPYLAPRLLLFVRGPAAAAVADADAAPPRPPRAVPPSPRWHRETPLCRPPRARTHGTPPPPPPTFPVLEGGGRGRGGGRGGGRAAAGARGARGRSAPQRLPPGRAPARRARLPVRA